VQNFQEDKGSQTCEMFIISSKTRPPSLETPKNHLAREPGEINQRLFKTTYHQEVDFGYFFVA